MAEQDKKMAEDKKKLAEERDARAKAKAAHDKVYLGRPTPTQEECDLIKLGHHPELEPDGSTDPDTVGKSLEAEGSRGGYQTRQMSSGSHRSSEAKA
jgi:hypothetical protein